MRDLLRRGVGLGRLRGADGRGRPLASVTLAGLLGVAARAAGGFTARPGELLAPRREGR